MEKIITKEYKCPVGTLLMGSHNNKLCLCDWKYRKMRDTIDRRINKFLGSEYEQGNSEILEETERQLSEYFEKTRSTFDIPLELAGSEFQLFVWQELMKVSYGETSSYSELAISMNKKEAIRAVASANGANGISIIVPCHRIIGTNGELVGYAGGLRAKEYLLVLESAAPEQYRLF
jgi:methylated-DNA-[protein]-cysteine S-methyltransferase